MTDPRSDGRVVVGETAATRWKRRAVSIPAILVLTATAVITAPLVALGLALADTLCGRRRLPRVRVHLVVLQYLVNDSVEIVLSPIYWTLAGFGTRLDSPTSRRRHARLQRWSLNVLARRADRLLGLRVEIDSEDELTPGPVIILTRHVSLADASLPALVYTADRGIDVRGVIMAELLSDPGFDLLYGRLGSIFVDRDRSGEALAAIEDLGRSLDRRSAAAIWPEGRLFEPAARDRALERLRTSQPERASRLAGLRHLLPPHPGGVLALLDGAPHADVVVIGHVGFESTPTVTSLARSAPVAHAIQVSVHRIDRSEIPDQRDERVRWLDLEWLALDAWIDERVGSGSDVPGELSVVSGMAADRRRVVSS